MMRQALRKLTRPIQTKSLQHPLVIFINQIRMKIRAWMLRLAGNQLNWRPQRAEKFYASVPLPTFPAPCSSGAAIKEAATSGSGNPALAIKVVGKNTAGRPPFKQGTNSTSCIGRGGRLSQDGEAPRIFGVQGPASSRRPAAWFPMTASGPGARAGENSKAFLPKRPIRTMDREDIFERRRSAPRTAGLIAEQGDFSRPATQRRRAHGGRAGGCRGGLRFFPRTWSALLEFGP